MELMTAIVFIKNKDYPIKYRKITNINRFVTFVQSKYPFATAINFYKKETKEFLKQIKI